MNNGKLKKLVCNLNRKKKYVVHIKTSKQVLNHRLVLQKVHRVIKFNQKAQLKQYIDMNTELEKKKKKLTLRFCKAWNIENVKNPKINKPSLTEITMDYLVSEPNHHTTKWFSKNLFVVEVKKSFN